MVVSLRAFLGGVTLSEKGMETLKFIYNQHKHKYLSYIYEEILYSPAGVGIKPWAERQ